MNISYIDKVKQEIFHEDFAVETRTQNKFHFFFNNKNLLFEFVHKYVYLIPQVYVNEMHIPYK